MRSYAPPSFKTVAATFQVATEKLEYALIEQLTFGFYDINAISVILQQINYLVHA